LVSRVWDISLGIGPPFPLAGGLCKLYANAGGKLQIQSQSLSVHKKQQAYPLILMYNCTQVLISGNDKKKQLTGPIQTGINRNKYTFCIMKSSEPLKNFNLKTSRVLAEA
jgi:hypothetical protein